MIRLSAFLVRTPVLTTLGLILLLAFGWFTAPFNWSIGALERQPVAVDAIPDISENQQIVFTEWPGRSPRDVEDQISYPLTVHLMGLPGVKAVRSNSMFGFSSITVLFEEGVEFYWSRSRLLEKLSSLPAGTLPTGVAARLGPDATPLGQIYWYTLEGHDSNGNPTGGWDLEELRTIQDWQVRWSLQGANGVAEVASIGGHVREYQIDVNPDALRAHHVSLADVVKAISKSNLDVGARTMEINGVEYVLRGIGFVQDPSDLENAVIRSSNSTPITVADVATVSLGPAGRRGVLDKAGAEAVGGVVVARYGANPMAVIDNVKKRIAKLSPSLPEKVLPNGTVSKLTIVPFYDRTELIDETLATLGSALEHEILVTLIVVLVLIRRIRASLLVAISVPVAVLGCFVLMKQFDVDANIVALSGIAIAIGTMVDMAIVVIENILRHLDAAPQDSNRRDTVIAATQEVAPAVMTAIATTVIGFLPVFAMTGAAGRLFTPLALTKTFALVAAAMIAVLVIPSLAAIFLKQSTSQDINSSSKTIPFALILTVAFAILWKPLGPDTFVLLDILLIGAIVWGFLGIFAFFQRLYPRILTWCLDHKAQFLIFPLAGVVIGGYCLSQLEEEFMPRLDEGSFLYMPTVMTHSSIGEATDALQKLDAAIAMIPEVDLVVGKIGRVDSALDPAPVSMIETVITWKPEFKLDKNGQQIRQWRDDIHSPNDIWDEILKVAQIPGLTSAPLLQPIETRRIMLQTGIRAPMAVKVQGPDLETIERAGLRIEKLLKQVPQIRPISVFADRLTGKPYLEIHIERAAAARHGMNIGDVQNTISTALGGQNVTWTVEGRKRFAVRVRYARERRDSIEALKSVLVDGPGGRQIPLGEIARIEYVQGPQSIASEDTFPRGYVIFDRIDSVSEVTAVEAARQHLTKNFDAGSYGVQIAFDGDWLNIVEARKTRMVVVPVTLVLIFMLLYLHFRRTSTTLFVFLAVILAAAGGMMMLTFWGANWSVAIGVGFLALAGIAVDDGVVLSTMLGQVFEDEQPTDQTAVRKAVVKAGSRRIRACLTTTATTLLALIPVLWSEGRGSEIMIPMALPTFGGMLFALVSLFTVPVMWSWREERALKH